MPDDGSTSRALTSQNGFPSASTPPELPEAAAVLAFFEDFDGATSSSPSGESLSSAARFFELLILILHLRCSYRDCADASNTRSISSNLTDVQVLKPCYLNLEAVSDDRGVSQGTRGSQTRGD